MAASKKSNTSKKTTTKKTTKKKSTKSKGGPKNVDWYAARKLYLTDNEVSYDDIAKKFGVSKTAVGNRAAAEDWTKLRQDLNEKAFDQFTAKLLDDKSQAQTRHLDLWRKVQTVAGSALDDIKQTEMRVVEGEEVPGEVDYVDSKRLKDLASVLKTAIDGERVVLGLPNNVQGISDPAGDNIWTGFSDMVAAAEEVLNAENESGGDRQTP